MSICLRRREFIAGLSGTAAAWPLAVSAQQTKPTIGWLTDALPPRDSVDAFRRGLAEIGFLEGRDVTVEYHTTDGHSERRKRRARRSGTHEIRRPRRSGRMNSRTTTICLMIL